MQKRGLRITLLLGLCICLAAFLIPGNAVKADGEIAINETNFPDPVFRNYVALNFDIDGDEALSSAEIADALTVTIYNEGCRSLEGIKFLTALENLNCIANSITELDLSGCSSLISIDCNNLGLESLDLSGCSAVEFLNCSHNNLTLLDVSDCTNLETLGCYDNLLTSLDLSGCANLNTLDCDSNNLTALDVSDCSKLTSLSCLRNQIISLDVSCCQALEWLYCSYNQLTNLDIEGCTKLIQIKCDDNQLTSLDISECSSLEELNCYENSITGLNLSKCSNLTFLGCGENNLTKLDLSNCPKLKDLYCYENYLAALDVSGHENLLELGCWSNLISDLKVNNCPSLISLQCDENSITALDLSGCTALQKLTCSGNELTSLSVAGLSDLYWLQCSENDLTSLNIDGCSDLLQISCNYNNLAELDLSGAPYLNSLYCYNNKLTGLDLSGSPELVYLYCDNNQLESLDFSACPNLIEVECNRNKLTSLDFSGCNYINVIWCDENELTELNVKNCENLYRLECSENRLTELDLSGCSSLNRLECGENSLTSINVNDCLNLEQLNVCENELESIDLSKNGLLIDFICQDNYLTELGVSNCPDLRTLNCAANQIDSLDLNNLEDLYILRCNENKLSSLDVSGCPYLEYLECQNNELTSINFGVDTILKGVFCNNNLLRELDLSNCPLLSELNCRGNLFTELDLSNCPEVKTVEAEDGLIESVSLAGCTKLTTIWINNNALTGLDLSSCTALEYLECNENALTELDLTPCTELFYLECQNNRLTNITGNTNLFHLNCAENELAELNLAGSNDLFYLSCWNNDLTSLDVSDCPELTYLYCSHNNLTSLDISNNPLLLCLECSYNNIETLDITANSNLCEVYAAEPEFPGYYTLEIPDPEEVGLTRQGRLIFDPEVEIIAPFVRVSIYSQPRNVSALVNSTAKFTVEARGTGLEYCWQASKDGGNTWLNSGFAGFDTKTLKVPVTEARNGYMFRCIVKDAEGNSVTSEPAKLTVVDELELIPIDDTIFPDEYFRGYIADSFDSDSDGYLSPDEIANITRIYIAGTEEYESLSSLEGVKYFTELRSLQCGGTEMTALDLEGMTKLEYIDVSSNELTDIELTGCAALTELVCNVNELTELDLSSLESLEYVSCFSNKLENINLTGCTALREISCFNNKLSSLDLSGCPNLVGLGCLNNNLETIDLSVCPKLESVSIAINKLKNLDISNNTKLHGLVIYRNELEYIDISNSPYLCEIYAEGPAGPPLGDGVYLKQDLIVDGEVQTGLIMLDPEVKIIAEYSAPVFTVQPSDKEAEIGTTADFSVEVTGIDLTYQWQTSKDGGTTWVNSKMTGYNTDTLTVSVIADRNGYMFRCVVTDIKGVEVISESTKLKVKSSAVITSQPQDVTTAAGTTVTFSVSATGTGLKYQWQTSKNGGQTWVNSGMTGYKTNTLTVSAIMDRNGYQFRCVITDGNNVSITSDAATLTVTSSAGPEITAQPENVTTTAGSTVTFSITAAGTGLKYQWQTSKNGGHTWVNSGMTGYNTNTLTVSAIIDRNGYQFRCVVTDKNGATATSNAAVLKVGSGTEGPQITAQPVNVTTTAGSTVTFSITAAGNGLKYQWQTSKNGGQTWVNSGMTGYNTNTLTVSAIIDRNGYQFRCVVTDKDGATATSNAAVLVVGSGTEGPQITAQPVNVTTTAGSTVTFSITATGSGLKYQWQTSKNGGQTWVNSGMTGYNTNTLTVSAIADRNGYQFRCVVTDKNGATATSNAAVLVVGSGTEGPQITAQPQNVTTAAGSTVTFSITATGSGIKYQWQTSKDGGKTWVNSGMTGYNTNTLTVSAIADRNGYQFRCVVTDKNGATATSNAAALTVNK